MKLHSFKRLLILTISGVILMINQLNAADFKLLVDGEKAFCQAAIKTSVKEAFVAFLADSSIVFRPKPVNGKRLYNEAPKRPGFLTWRPVYAEMSNGGNFGYTTGPWEFRKETLTEAAVAFGHYVSIWQKQPDNQWKVVLDVGNSYEKPAHTLPDTVLTTGEKRFAGANTLTEDAHKAAQQRLLSTAMIFSEAAEKDGVSAALRSLSVKDVRLYRDEAFPTQGKDAAVDPAIHTPPRLFYETENAFIADYGDLGYNYGIVYHPQVGQTERAEYGSFLQIWRRQPTGEWKIALDLINAFPPEKNER